MRRSNPIVLTLVLLGTLVMHVAPTAAVWSPLAMLPGTLAGPPPGVLALPGATWLAAGAVHTCAVLTSGGVKCWGNNDIGQLGDGTTTYRVTPVDVNGLSSGVANVTAGMAHTCAVLTNGGVKCWGLNIFGQLGDGTTTDQLTPMDVSGLSSGVVAMAAGEGHTCAVLTNGGVKCWGYNDSGQLGDGTHEDRLTPVDVNGLSSGVVAITAGMEHTCALLISGGVKCWGYNRSGQLGDGTITERLTPVDVSGLSNGVVAMTAGLGHTCAVLTSGGAKCWGRNSRYQIGDGTHENRLTPVDVSGLSNGVVAMAAGSGHTCAVLTSGGAKCWGYNEFGQLGDRTRDTRSTPVDVSRLSNGVASITAGDNHTCTLLMNSGVKCWGENYWGQVGDGLTWDQLFPVCVVGFTGCQQPSAFIPVATQ